MSKNLKIAAVGVAVLAGLLVAYLGGYETAKKTELNTATAQVAPKPETPILAQNTQSESNGEQLVAEITAIDPEDVDPASIDWAAMKARFKVSYDPMMSMGWGGTNHLAENFTEQEIAAYNKLHVVPFNPALDLVCQQKSDDNPGSVDGVLMSCEPVFSRPPHSYENLDLNELTDLARTDAVAAVILGRRTPNTEPNEKTAWFTRAVALSGKSGPLLWLATNEHAETDISGAPNSQRYLQFVRNHLLRRIVLERLAADLNDPRAEPEVWSQRISEVFDEKDLYKVGDMVDQRVDQHKYEIHHARKHLGLAPLFEGDYDA